MWAIVWRCLGMRVIGCILQREERCRGGGGEKRRREERSEERREWGTKTREGERKGEHRRNEVELTEHIQC